MDVKKLARYGRLSKSTWNKLTVEDAEFYILTEKDKREKNGIKMGLLLETRAVDKIQKTSLT